ncbi:hypothetical protein MC885_012753 [Smutsia gigantea]|nr:hypothetical protein MC885_012753 [Smutsia gigantea]
MWGPPSSGDGEVCCPGNCPPTAMATAIAGSSSPPCPLGISAATRSLEGMLELQRLRLRGEGGGGQGSPARAAAERRSLAR